MVRLMCLQIKCGKVAIEKERDKEMEGGGRERESSTERLNEGPRERRKERKTIRKQKCASIDMLLFASRSHCDSYGRVGSWLEETGSINPFIVALISQPQSISLLKLAMDQKLLVGSQQNQ